MKLNLKVISYYIYIKILTIQYAESSTKKIISSLERGDGISEVTVSQFISKQKIIEIFESSELYIRYKYF